MPDGWRGSEAPQTLSEEHPAMNSSSNAPWKDGRERSDRWKETLGKGFLPRVSDRTHWVSPFLNFRS